MQHACEEANHACNSIPKVSRTCTACLHRYGAFAVAMVLSLASAIPIVFVCRLPECARRAHAAFDTPYA